MKSDYISMDEYEIMSEALPSPYKQLLRVAIGTGFRISDLCAAHKADFTRDNVLKIKEQKTGKLREVKPMQSALTDLLMRSIRAMNKPDDSPLFATYDGKPLNRKTAWRWCKRAWAESNPGDERQISPHSMRKAYAVSRRKTGATLAEVQKDLGHENASTTMLYYFADMLADPQKSVNELDGNRNVKTG